MLRRSTNLLLLALAATAVPAISKSTFGPQSRATINLASSLPENEPVLAIESRGGDMSVQDKAVSGAATFLLMDTVVRKSFRANKIAIPPQLGGCIILFATMLLSETILPGMGDRIFKALAPGAALLTKWLPVFFVPGLAMLPLAPSIGNTLDVRSRGAERKLLVVNAVALTLCFIELSTLLFSPLLSLVSIFLVVRLHFRFLHCAKRLARSTPTHLKGMSHQFEPRRERLINLLCLLQSHS